MGGNLVTFTLESSSIPMFSNRDWKTVGSMEEEAACFECRGEKSQTCGSWGSKLGQGAWDLGKRLGLEACGARVGGMGTGLGGYSEAGKKSQGWWWKR